ncbi:hypothetical protein ES705_23269 [subsurface metagenome]
MMKQGRASCPVIVTVKTGISAIGVSYVVRDLAILKVSSILRLFVKETEKFTCQITSILETEVT